LNQSKESLFKEKLTFDLINNEFLRHEFSNSILAWMKRNDINTGKHWEREDVITALDKLSIRHCSYSAFYNFLKGELINLNESPGDATLKKLIKGLTVELENRKLV
jgi:hypothetical protein